MAVFFLFALQFSGKIRKDASILTHLAVSTYFLCLLWSALATLRNGEDGELLRSLQTKHLALSLSLTIIALLFFGGTSPTGDDVREIRGAAEKEAEGARSAQNTHLNNGMDFDMKKESATRNRGGGSSAGSAEDSDSDNDGGHGKGKKRAK